MSDDLTSLSNLDTADGDATDSPYGTTDSPFVADGSPLSASNWRPAGLATAVVLLGTLAVAAALVAATGLGAPVSVAAAGAVCLAASVWLSTRERFRLPAVFGASLLSLPAGAGLAVGVGYTVLKQLQGSYAVGSVFVVFGLTVAAFGAAAAVRDVVTGDDLLRTLSVAARTVVLPVVAAAGLAVLRLTPVGDFLDAFLGFAGDALFEPTPATRPHLASLCLLGLAAAAAARSALRQLPLLAFTPSDVAADAAAFLDGTESTLTALVHAGVFVLPPLALVEFAASTAVYGRLPAKVVRLLVALSNATDLRRFLVAAAFLAAAVAVLAWAIQRFYRASALGTLVYASPLAGGALVVAAAFVAHRRTLDVLMTTVTALLPPELADEFTYQATAIVDFYGPDVVVVGLATATLLTAALVLGVLFVGEKLGFLSGRAAGAGLAGTGLFVAAALARTVGVDSLVVLGCLVGSLVVWDAGSFGVALGREIGTRGPTRQVELVHVGSTLVVGVVAAAVALGLSTQAGDVTLATTVPTLFALAAATAGAVLFVFALR